jgi:hypothetical protein
MNRLFAGMSVVVLALASSGLLGCGTTYSGSGASSSGGGVNYAGQAQGVYSGTSSNGYAFSTIVLPNVMFYAIYGTATGNTLLLAGFMTGQGTSGNGTYAATVHDYFYTGAVNSGSVSATYVAGSSLNGTLNENATMTTFTGASLPASSFNYSTPASLSAISGTWAGTLLDGMTTTVTISSSGIVSGSSSGCSFSGTVAADISNKNFFDVSLTFAGSPCAFPNQTATGIGVEYLLSDGITHQLLAGVTAGTSLGTVFAAER